MTRKAVTSNPSDMGIDNHSDKVQTGLKVHSLKIGRPADDLASMASGFFQQHRHGTADHRSVEVPLLFKKQGLKVM